MVHASLFSGIGGFDLAAEMVGWDNAFSCEIDPFCNHVLKFHFPDETQYNDIRNTDFSVWRGRVDVLSGGFPCQPFSQAGKRKGTDDDRHLWPAMLTAIRQIRPRWVVGENVFGIVNWNAGMVFEQVCADLEAEGYQVQPFVLPACGVDAPHRRYRTFFIAYRDDDKCESWIELDQQRGQTAAADGGTTSENADGNGCLYSDREKESGQRQQRDAGTGDIERLCLHKRVAPDADNSRLQRSGAEQPPAGTAGIHPGVIADTDGIRPQNLQTDCSRQYRDPSERGNIYGGVEDVGIQQSLTDSGGQQLQKWTPHGIAPDREEDGAGMDSRPERSGDIEPTPDSGCELRECGDGETAQGWPFAPLGIESSGFAGAWDFFPTQPPVCGRDDGFSEWLDPTAVFKGVTPSKRAIPYNRWRTESIKAYGNAVVVPLIVQIFRAIDLYMKMYVWTAE